MRGARFRLDKGDLGVVSVRINSPYNSFFGKVSELSGSRIVMSTYKVPGSDSYYVLALSSDKGVREYVGEVAKHEKYVKRSKIKELRHHYGDDMLVIHGVKSRCEFLRVLLIRN